MVISCLYVQTVTRQCFCFPNSQWGVTTHDIPPQREDRKLDISENIKFLSAKQKHAMEKRSQYFIHTKCSCCPVESIRVGSDADGVFESGIRLRTSNHELVDKDTLG